MVINPVALLVRDPVRVDSRPPGITIVGNLLPVTVVVQIVYPWDRVVNVLITRIAPVRVVVVRVVHVSVIAGIPSVVSVSVLITIIVVNQITCIAIVNARQRCFSRSRAENGQHFALADPAARALPN